MVIRSNAIFIESALAEQVALQKIYGLGAAEGNQIEDSDQGIEG